MKKFNNTIIIGIDHGYGNMKTVNCCFSTGLIAYDSEPLFTKELLVYNGKYYLKGKSSLMIFDRHANLKYKYGSRHF